MLAFANSLVDKGVDVLLDRYTPVPPEGWPHWMEDNLDAADFVLMVCTETYHRRVKQREKPGTGLGVRWEGNLIYSRLYSQEPQGHKYLPVLFQAADAAFVPGPTQGHTRFLIQGFDLADPQYEALYRHLTGQPATPRPELGRLVVLSPLPRQVHPVPTERLWNVPYPRNPFFTGREDVLAQLHAALASGTPAALTQPQAISGLGGIGKTQTMVEYAYRHQDEYQAVLWVSAVDETTLREGFVGVARWLGLPQAQEANQGLAVQAVKAWLERAEGWLLLLDNADEPKWVKPFLPSQRKGHVLMTTRASATGALARKVELRKLSEADGALLLLRRAKLIAEDATLDVADAEDKAAALALSREVDGLPLALDQAGAFIEETPSSPAVYLVLYKSEGAALLAEYGDPEDRDHLSAHVTYSLAFAKVAAASPAAGELVRACAFLAPDAIPEEIFTGGDAALNEGAGPFGMSGLAWEKIVGEACRYSLLSRDVGTRTVSIHRLVQTVIRHEMDEDTRKAQAERLVRAVADAFPTVDVSTWPQCERLLPHARTCAAHIADHALEFAEAAWLLNQAGYYLYERGQYAEVEPLCQWALLICEKVLGPEHPGTALSLNNLALLYDSQGRYEEALPLYQRALLIQEAAPGPEHPDTASILNNLAMLYFAQGNYGAVEPLLKRALVIREAAPGPEHPDTASTLNNLAELHRMEGRYEEALPLLQRALLIYEKALGPEHPSTATSLNNLAELHHTEGRYEEALPLYQRALSIQEQSLGPDHSNIAVALNNLAMLYFIQGNYEEALPLLQRALTICEKVLGPEHPTTNLLRENYTFLLD